MQDLKSYQKLKRDYIGRALKRRILSSQYIAASPSRRYKAIEHAKVDPVFFIRMFGWTYDPRNGELGLPNSIPMDPFPIQEKYVRWVFDVMNRQTNGLTEKSRGEGMTWMWVFIALHQYLFTNQFKAGFGSYKQDKVDRIGDPDSIFEKFRIAFRALPSFLIPPGYVAANHDNFLRFMNPHNGSVIVGEAGDDIGRGGRSSVYFVDEFAFLNRAEKADAALSGNTDCIHYGSTSNGTNTLQYQKKMTFPSENIFRLHWKDNPTRNQDWKDELDLKFDPITIAREYDIDYTSSAEDVVIPAKWVESAVNLDLTRGKVAAGGFDVGGGGKMNESSLIIRKGGYVDRVIAWKGEDPTQAILRTAKIMDGLPGKPLIYDADGIGASVSGTIANRDQEAKFDIYGIHGNNPPSDTRYDDAPDLKAGERFANVRAESWWSMRLRFQRTYMAVYHGSDYPDDELISLPDDAVLISQLSLPRWKLNGRGKILIESKQEMKKKGIRSPDRADALVLSFYPAISSITKDILKKMVI